MESELEIPAAYRGPDAIVLSSFYRREDGKEKYSPTVCWGGNPQEILRVVGDSNLNHVAIWRGINLDFLDLVEKIARDLEQGELRENQIKDKLAELMEQGEQ